MSERITLTLRVPLTERLDADAIAPDRLAALDAKEISELQLWAGRTAVPLGDVFNVDGERSPKLMLDGDLTQLHGVGTLMSAGTLEIMGSVGNAIFASAA